MLSPGWLLDGEGDDHVLQFTPDPIAQVRLAPTDLTQGLFAARRIQLFEPVEAVTAIAHHLAGLRDVAQLLRELQNPHLGLDNFLFSRHALSMSDCQITS